MVTQDTRGRLAACEVSPVNLSLSAAQHQAGYSLLLTWWWVAVEELSPSRKGWNDAIKGPREKLHYTTDIAPSSFFGSLARISAMPITRPYHTTVSSKPCLQAYCACLGEGHAKCVFPILVCYYSTTPRPSDIWDLCYLLPGGSAVGAGERERWLLFHAQSDCQQGRETPLQQRSILAHLGGFRQGQVSGDGETDSEARARHLARGKRKRKRKRLGALRISTSILQGLSPLIIARPCCKPNQVEIEKLEGAGPPKEGDSQERVSLVHWLYWEALGIRSVRYWLYSPLLIITKHTLIATECGYLRASGRLGTASTGSRP